MSEWDINQVRVSDAIKFLRDHLDHEHIPSEHTGPDCALCRSRRLLVEVIARADRMYRSEKSMVTERVRRENDELRQRLRITTDLLEGRTPRV